MSKRHTVLPGFIFCLLPVITSTALAVVVEIPALQDNTIYESTAPFDFSSATANHSNGAGNFIFTGQNNNGLNRRALISFDIASAAPPGSIITSATLRLYLSQTITVPSFTVTDTSLHRVLRDWGEGSSNAVLEEGVGANAQPGDATWLHTFFSDETWSTPGGDFEASASATNTVGDKFLFYQWTGAGLVDDAQNWLDNPEGNFGWILVGDESMVQTAKRFDSLSSFETDIATGFSTRPLLTLEFTPIPEPGTLWLLLAGLGAAVGFARRPRA